ncbi:MAG: PPOX class F420-dependent oxidoreductase [Candidatus Thorarchaeota archaeon]
MSESKAKSTLTELLGNKYINLTTFRENGEAVPTPVMFAEANGKLYVETRLSRYKVNRIKNNPKVQFSSCTMKGKVLGPMIEGTARILPTSDQSIAFEALREKYFRFRLGDSLSKIKSSRNKLKNDDRVYIEIVPNV